MNNFPRPTRFFSGHEMVPEADSRIRAYIRETSLEPAPQLEVGEGTVWLKLENQQRTGSFKVRGAVNRLLTLTDAERALGVVTASSGNYGLGLAYAAECFSVGATILAPTTIDSAKKRELERYPIELIVAGEDIAQSEACALEVAQKKGRTFISPYSDPDVIAGHGTIALELAKQLPEMDVLFIAVGGGGLIAGVAAYAKAIKPSIVVVAVSPSNSPAMFDELANTPYEFRGTNATLSDSTAGSLEEGSITIDLCRALIDQWILVEEDEIRAAMKYLFYEHRQVVEGAGALCVAGYLKERDRYRDLNTVILVCGGNIDMQQFCDVVG
jgi:threonine dehydratase